MKRIDNLDNVEEFITQLNKIIENEKHWKRRFDSKDMLYRDSFARWQFYMKEYHKLGGEKKYGTV